MVEASPESVPVAEAARLLGVSARTVKRLCEAGRLSSFRTAGAGGHLRILKAEVEAFRQGSGKHALNPASGVLQNRRERVEELALEAQELRAKREIEKLRQEDSEAERNCATTARAEELERTKALEHQRTEAERHRKQQQTERFRRRCFQWAASRLPDWASAEQAQALTAAVDGLLSSCAADDREDVVLPILETAVQRLVNSWRVERNSNENREQTVWRGIEHIVFDLPFWGTTDADRAQAAKAIRETVSQLPLTASDQELREAIAGVIAPIRQVIEKRVADERAQAQAERERQQRESMKRLLVDVGVGAVSPYISKLQLDGELWDEDLDRKAEFEDAVRNALEGKLTGAESFEQAQRIAREVVDKELQ